MSTFLLFTQVVIPLLLTTYCISGNSEHRHSRQVVADNNFNMPMAQPKSNPSMQSNNNVPPMLSNNPNMPNNNNIPSMQSTNLNMPINSNVPLMSFNNPNVQKNQPINSNIPPMMTNNQQMNPKQMMNNEQLLSASRSQMDQARSQGFYNNPHFQAPPFSGGKPDGWFGTNHMNWVSLQDSELDKNKLAGAKHSPPNNSPVNFGPINREDGGPAFLIKVAKQYASNGNKAFDFGPYENLQGRGAVCSNYDNIDGFIFGRFACPLPLSTGMNQMDMFCCGPVNYQYCCNIQEFSQNQRGAFGDNRFLGDQRFPKPTTYPSSTKKILAVVLPIVSILVLTGVGILVFLYYKKFRQAQYRLGKPNGAIRLQDNYSALAQDLPNEQHVLSN